MAGDDRIGLEGTALRNLFDQYRHAENRLTHAFFTVLNHDRRLLAGFLRDFVKSGRGQKAEALSISVQTIPGKPEEPEQSESERYGIPDAWIHNGEDWCVVVEAKINAPLTVDQIRRHRFVDMNHPQQSVVAHRQHRAIGKSRRRSATERQTKVVDDCLQPLGAPAVTSQYAAIELFAEDSPAAQNGIAPEPTCHDRQLYSPPTEGKGRGPAQISTLHSSALPSAVWTSS
jgi:hypothetical protein